MQRPPITIVIVSIAAALFLGSLVPLATLYLSPDPVGTSSNAGTAQELRSKTGDYFGFIALSDNHAGLPFNDSATLKLIRNMNREDRFRKLPIDFVIFLGDVTFRGSAWDYRIFDKIRSRIKYPVLAAIGNHDDDNEGHARFVRAEGQTDFSFTDRNAYFIVIRNIESDIDESRFAWFEDELKKSQEFRHRFIIMHKPPHSLYFQSWYRPELSPWSRRVMDLCERYGVDMVLSGHEHLFASRTFGKVTYVTSGGGGMLIQVPSWDGGVLHYVVVRVFGDYVDFEVRKIFPPFWDFCVYYVWKDLLYALKALVI